MDGLILVVSHPWSCLFQGAQELTSLVRRLNLVITYSGRRRNFSVRCYKRSGEAITVICLQTLKTFLPEYEYHYSLNGSCSRCRLEVPRDPGGVHAGSSYCKAS